jgi:hypothetical protein
MSPKHSRETAPEHIRPAITRRDVLTRAAHGFGALALQYLLEREGFAAARENPLAPKPQHFPAKAKSVIFLFMVGAPSHIDTFDPKPALKKYEGQQLPESFGKIPSQFTNGDTPLLASPWQFKKYGQSGIEVSSLFRISPMWTTYASYGLSTQRAWYAPAMYQVHTGRLMGTPAGVLDHLWAGRRGDNPGVRGDAAPEGT